MYIFDFWHAISRGPWILFTLVNGCHATAVFVNQIQLSGLEFRPVNTDLNGILIILQC